MNNVDMEQRLWEYIDGFSTAGEASLVETLIRENKEWRELYHELLQVHQSLEGINLEVPSLRFTKNVMEELARHQIAPAAKNYINHKIIWGIVLFFIISIAGSLIYGIGQIDWNLSAQPATQFGVDFSKVEYKKAFGGTVMNVFMMLNAVLGLMLADRYFSNKRKNAYKSA